LRVKLRPSILVVDDDERVRSSLARVLSRGGARVRTAASARSALAAVDEEAPDLVISDVRMPEIDGLELLRRLHELAPGTDVVMMTAFDDLPTISTAMRDGAVDLLVKPLDLHQLRLLVERILADRSIRSTVRGEVPSAVPPGGLVGRDPQMIEVYKRIGRAAATRSTVLVRGETGTGKELVARAIHETSASRELPFVAVDCTAIPESLIEAELFGHVRGAFTGADRDRRGRFLEAGGGTIFLDEVGDTSAAFQAKLLRALQESEVRAIGADRPVPFAARVVAATHRDLESMVEKGAFREDLYYRLRVVEIALPPLRERLGDLRELAEALAARAAAAAGRRSTPRLDEGALEALVAHDWPGNVRELESCLARAVVLNSGDLLRREDLGFEHTAPTPAPELASLEAIERRHVERVLAATGGNKTRAAEILGISRPRLRRIVASPEPED